MVPNEPIQATNSKMNHYTESVEITSISISKHKPRAYVTANSEYLALMTYHFCKMIYSDILEMYRDIIFSSVGVLHKSNLCKQDEHSRSTLMNT